MAAPIDSAVRWPVTLATVRDCGLNRNPRKGAAATLSGT